MELNLDENDASDWVYRGEGAANLILSYSGSSPTFVGKVLRIQKIPRNKTKCVDGSSITSTHECLLWKDVDGLISSPTKEDIEQRFVQCVMSPLLGSEHVDAGIRVLVSRKFLEFVEKNLMCDRPDWRIHAARINTLVDSALLMSDHAIFPNGSLKAEPCISVEIKPKCGFLPFSAYIAEENAIKKSVTRFRLHQVLKLHQQEISQISQYDPLDLFSGSRDQIHKAIKSLFTTPQNNFRVFLNGSLIFGGLGGGTDSTTPMVSKAFEDVIKCVIQAHSGFRTTTFLELVSEAVFKSEALKQLLQVQKLDSLDIEGAIHVYYDIISQPCLVCRDLGDDKLTNRCMELHALTLDEKLKVVRDYLIAVTAKDCSVMISFRPRGDEDAKSPFVYLKSTNQSFDYKAYVIDLDMKSLKKMEHYYQLDQKIVRCYATMVKEHESDKASDNEILQLSH